MIRQLADHLMFRNRDNGYKKRSSFLPFVILRVFLSLAMMSVFAFGVYSAYKHFSGVDPLSLDPKAIVLSWPSILGAKLPDSISDVKKVLMVESGKDENKSDEFKGKPTLVFSFGLVADSHNNLVDLRKSLSQLKDKWVSFIVGLGDYSDVGTLEELEGARQVFEASGLPFYLTAGDHDLWDCNNRGMSSTCNFETVFGPAYQSFRYAKIRFIILNNSDNNNGFDQTQLIWLEEELARGEDTQLTLVFMHEPLYHPSSDHVMGKTNPKLRGQAEHVVKLLKDSGVNEVFAGDTHFFSRYQEPKQKLKMTAVGALSRERNAQVPRFALIDVYQDGSYKVSDIEVK